MAVRRQKTGTDIVEATAATALPEAAAGTETGALISLLERATRDPNIDIDKLERVVQVYERIEKRRTEAAFNKAFAAAQAEMSPVVKNQRNNQTNSNYADLSAIAEAITPIYTRHGFGTSFGSKPAPDGFIGIVMDLMHEEGFSKRFEYDVPADGVGIKGNANMTRIHAMGSTFSYGRRYAKVMAWDVATKDDKDGNAPQAGGTITDDQVKEIKSALERTGGDLDKFLAMGNLETLEDMKAVYFQSAMKLIEVAGQKRGSSQC